MNVVNLKFDKSLVALAGNPYGKSIFVNQVKGKYDLEDGIVICFPENIEKVASSFVQGFFSEWLNSEGLNEIREKVTIHSFSEKLSQSIMENLE